MLSGFRETGISGEVAIRGSESVVRQSTSCGLRATDRTSGTSAYRRGPAPVKGGAVNRFLELRQWRSAPNPANPSSENARRRSSENARWGGANRLNPAVSCASRSALGRLAPLPSENTRRERGVAARFRREGSRSSRHEAKQRVFSEGVSGLESIADATICLKLRRGEPERAISEETAGRPPHHSCSTHLFGRAWP